MPNRYGSDISSGYARIADTLRQGMGDISAASLAREKLGLEADQARYNIAAKERDWSYEEPIKRNAAQLAKEAAQPFQLRNTILTQATRFHLKADPRDAEAFAAADPSAVANLQEDLLEVPAFIEDMERLTGAKYDPDKDYLLRDGQPLTRQQISQYGAPMMKLYTGRVRAKTPEDKIKAVEDIMGMVAGLDPKSADNMRQIAGSWITDIRNQREHERRMDTLALQEKKELRMADAATALENLRERNAARADERLELSRKTQEDANTRLLARQEAIVAKDTANKDRAASNALTTAIAKMEQVLAGATMDQALNNMLSGLGVNVPAGGNKDDYATAVKSRAADLYDQIQDEGMKERIYIRYKKYLEGMVEPPKGMQAREAANSGLPSYEPGPYGGGTSPSSGVRQPAQFNKWRK